MGTVGGSFPKGMNCWQRPWPEKIGERFHEVYANQSCSAIGLMTLHLNRLFSSSSSSPSSSSPSPSSSSSSSSLSPRSLSFFAYNLAISACGHFCLIESIQGYYLSPNAVTLHIVFVDVCPNDLTTPVEELRIAYMEVVSFVRKRGGEVVFVCSWPWERLHQHAGPPKPNYNEEVLSYDENAIVAHRAKEISFNSCMALGIQLSRQYLFPLIHYQDALLSKDASFSAGSEKSFYDSLSALILPQDTHPSMLGYDFVARTISRWLYLRILHVLSLLQPLPHPQIPLINHSTTSLKKLIDTKEEFTSMAIVNLGFEWRVEAKDKAGWISTTFGSKLVLQVESPVTVGFLSIGYLQTYSTFGLFSLVVRNGNHTLYKRCVTSFLPKHFSQTGFITIPINVTPQNRILLIGMEHLNHTNFVQYLMMSPGDKMFYMQEIGRKDTPSAYTKVKIVSIGIFDSEDGLANRPRDVSYA